MHRALREQGIERAIADYVIHGSTDRPAVTGRLVGKGMHDELTGEAFAVIDGIDGRVHYVRFPDLDRLEYAPPLGGIVATRTFEFDGKSRSSQVLSVRSDLTLEAEVSAPVSDLARPPAACSREISLSEGGFGREVREALQARVDHLASEGLVRRQGNRIIFARNLLDTLRQHEIDSAATQITAYTGLAHRPLAEGEDVAGTYRKRFSLASGRFAMIDGGPGFSLVPWRPALERELGRHVLGLPAPAGSNEPSAASVDLRLVRCPQVCVQV